MTYSALPGAKKIESDVIDRLNQLSLTSRMPTDIEVAGLRREIARVGKADTAASHNLLGMLSALELDLDSAIAHHRKAIRSSGNSPKYRNHYAVTLAKFFVFDEAIAILEQLANSDPADLSILKLLINTSMSGGRYRLANKWSEIWSTRCPENPYEDADMLASHIIPFLDAAGMEDSDVGPLFDRALRIPVKHRKHVASSYIRWTDGENEEDDSSFCLVVCLDEPPEIVADLVSELCESEAEFAPIDNFFNKVSVTFNPIAA